MAKPRDDLQGCPSAFDCRDRLPALSSWMSDDDLKLLPIWDGARFEAGKEYYDLDHPERGPFMAAGDEGRITDHTYVCRDLVPERVWAKLVTWRQMPSTDQARAIAMDLDEVGIEGEQSAAGPA